MPGSVGYDVWKTDWPSEDAQQRIDGAVRVENSRAYMWNAWLPDCADCIRITAFSK